MKKILYPLIYILLSIAFAACHTIENADLLSDRRWISDAPGEINAEQVEEIRIKYEINMYSNVYSVKNGFLVIDDARYENEMPTVVKAGANGKIIWKKKYANVFGKGTTGLNHSLLEFADESFAFDIGGTIVKCDRNGRVQWSKDLREETERYYSISHTLNMFIDDETIFVLESYGRRIKPEYENVDSSDSSENYPSAIRATIISKDGAIEKQKEFSSEEKGADNLLYKAKFDSGLGFVFTAESPVMDRWFGRYMVLMDKDLNVKWKTNPSEFYPVQNFAADDGNIYFINYTHNDVNDTHKRFEFFINKVNSNGKEIFSKLLFGYESDEVRQLDEIIDRMQIVVHNQTLYIGYGSDYFSPNPQFRLFELDLDGTVISDRNSDEFYYFEGDSRKNH